MHPLQLEMMDFVRSNVAALHEQQAITHREVHDEHIEADAFEAERNDIIDEDEDE